MTIDEIEKHLAEWAQNVELTDERMSAMFDALKLQPESPLYAMVWELQDAYTKTMSKLVGDFDGWLSWYRVDNDMGLNKGEAAPFRGKLRKIKNVRDLAKLIVESSNDVKCQN